MRAMESILGIRGGRVGGMDPMLHMKKLFEEGKLSKLAWEYLQDIETRPSINDLLLRWLSRTPINGSVKENSDDSEKVTNYVNHHIKSMHEHGQKVIEHMISIGHGQREPLTEGLIHKLKLPSNF